MASRVTMQDISNAAGVSVATVSRALANHPAIPERTREHVLQIARDLNYRVDERARNFRLQRSGTVAVLLPYSGESRRLISDPFYLEIVGAISDALDPYGYDLVIARVPVGQAAWASRYVMDRRVDGVLLIDRAVDDPNIEALMTLGAPFVVWGAALSGQTYASVGGDGIAGGTMAVTHLAHFGRRCIGFIGGYREMVETTQRRLGYERGLKAAGLHENERLIVYTDFTPDAAQGAAHALLDRNPTLDAIFVCSDFMAVGVMEVLRARGRRVPEDVSIVGYDDIPLARYCSPPLTTIHQPIHEGGRQMVESLFSLLNGEPPTPITLPLELVIRGS